MVKGVGLIVGLAASLPLAACSHRSPVAPVQATSAYQTNFEAPSGLARVYILPTHSKGIYSDLDGRAELSIFPESSERGALLGATGRTTFIAFDIAPGGYDLIAKGGDAFSKINRFEEFSAGGVYFLRPTFFRTAKDLASATADAGMGFDEVAPADAKAEIRGMAMVQLSAKTEEFLHRTYARPVMPAAVPAAPMAAPANPPSASVTAQPAPPPAATDLPSGASLPAGEGLEQKLRTLQRLRQQGLITAAEYEAKRKALIDAY